MFERGVLDLLHAANRSLMGAVCDYESYRGAFEVLASMGRHDEVSRHEINTKQMVNETIRILTEVQTMLDSK